MASVSRTSGPDLGEPQALAEEAELIRRCRLGQRDAHEEFYRRYRRGVAANLYRVLNDRSDLDDLVQDVFVIAFRGLDRFRGEARVSTWLYRICINVAMGKIRSRTRRPPPVSMADPELHADSEADTGHPMSVPRSETPEQALEREEERERVRRALDSLPPKKRIVLYLHEIEGHDLKEIAYLVDANPVTVRTRLFYARKDFYRKIAEDEERAPGHPVERSSKRARGGQS